MTNENKKINELVEIDSDPTAECEALTARQFEYEPVPAPALETEERTHAASDPESTPTGPQRAPEVDPAAQAEIIERLRYDLEQFRSKWLGLKAEIQSREKLAERLDDDLRGTRSKLLQVVTLLGAREAALERLRSRVEAKDLEYETLKRRFEQTRITETGLEADGETSPAREQLLRYEGEVAGLEAALSALREKQRNTESYADTLRQQLSDLRADSREVFGERDDLQVQLADARSTISALQAQLAATAHRAEDAEGALAAARDVHERELRLLRFELSTAQETLAESAQVTEQLASDLAQNRGHTIELERVLTDHDRQSQDRIEVLNRQVGQLEKALADYERKLETKSNAITALMNNEVSRHNHAATGIGADDQATFDTPAGGDSGAGRQAGDRVTRLLVGQFGAQQLRFPLFKNRLTIGRTRENDIYLKAEFISRHHAVIVNDSQATRIIDWGSKNGVYVNSKRVTEHFLKSGDRIRIGPIEFRYEELPRR